MKAKLTAQADSTYTGHMRTCREPQQVEFATGSYRRNALLAHLCSAFLIHFVPKPVANADQKKERVDRSVETEASLAAVAQERMQAQEQKGARTEQARGRPPYPQGKRPLCALSWGRKRQFPLHSRLGTQYQASGSWPPGLASRSSRNVLRNKQATWKSRHRSTRL